MKELTSPRAFRSSAFRRGIRSCTCRVPPEGGTTKRLFFHTLVRSGFVMLLPTRGGRVLTRIEGVDEGET